ncbi:MAG TPA: TonB-dependent receptor [Candidatus Baltobacteraceae bacterium]|nr:TonB-dependent receptor [Candidatus Baltobacteraceae bacterium]
MLHALLLALVAATPSPSPSPSASPSPLPSSLPVISNVRVATGSPQTLHALPVAASLLDGAAIASSSSYTADALLRALPGFDRTRSNSLFTNYGQLRVSFAGAGNDRGLVLADGIPAQDGFGGQVDWAAYPASDVQRAELLLGAGSALYGAGAVGGVLDVQTYAPPSQPLLPTGRFSVSAANNAFSEQWMKASASVVPRVNAAVALQQQRMQYVALPPSSQSSNSGISQADARMSALRLRYAMNARDTLEFGQRGAWDDQNQGRPNYTFSRRFNQTELRYTHSAAQSTVQGSVYSRNTFVVNVADQFPANPGVLRYVQYVPTNESGASVRWITGGGPSTLELLADARHVGGESTQFAGGSVLQNAGSGLQSLGGFAAQETWQVPRFELVAGARFDTVRSYGEQLLGVSKGVQTVRVPPDRTDEAISPRIAVRYDLTRGISLRASAGSGLRAPFLNELVRGFFIGSVAFQPNPALIPERSHTTSTGLDFLGGRSHLSLDAFDTAVNDAIMFRTIDPTHQLRSNVARTHTDAYMLSFTQSLGACSRLSAWMTTQNARVEAGPAQIVGKRLQYVPEQSASIDYAGRVGAVGAGVSVSYVGQTFADDLNTQPLGTAVLVGARARIPLADGASIDVRADNLTNARYLSSIDRVGPPALVAVGVTLPVGRSAAAANACLP